MVAGTRPAGDATLLAVTVTATKRRPGSRGPGQEARIRCPGGRLRGDAGSKLPLLAGLLVPVHGARAGRGDPAPLLPGPVFLRRSIPPRRTAHAPPGRLDRGCGNPAPVERGLPPRPEHPDDLCRLPDLGPLRRGALLPGVPLEPAAPVQGVRAALLRRARRSRAHRS